jgi:hypothetical protein
MVTEHRGKLKVTLPVCLYIGGADATAAHLLACENCKLFLLGSVTFLCPTPRLLEFWCIDAFKRSLLHPLRVSHKSQRETCLPMLRRRIRGQRTTSLGVVTGNKNGVRLTFASKARTEKSYHQTTSQQVTASRPPEQPGIILFRPISANADGREEMLTKHRVGVTAESGSCGTWLKRHG